MLIFFVSCYQTFDTILLNCYSLHKLCCFKLTLKIHVFVCAVVDTCHSFDRNNMINETKLSIEKIMFKRNCYIVNNMHFMKINIQFNKYISVILCEGIIRSSTCTYLHMGLKQTRSVLNFLMPELHG